MKRREFIGGMATVAVAAASAPARASLSIQRAWHARIAARTVSVHVGAERPFSVLHVSDTHLGLVNPDEAPSEHALAAKCANTWGDQSFDAFKATVSWAKNCADMLVHTGDLMDWGSQGNLDAVKKHLAGTEFFGCVGNHDVIRVAGASEDGNREAIYSRLRSFLPFNPFFDSRVLNGVNFVSMDNSFGCMCGMQGRVLEEQVRLFKAEAEKGLPIVLLVHSPIMTEGITSDNALFWNVGKFRGEKTPPPEFDALTGDFVKYLRSERLLKCILAGHLHNSVEDRFSPTAMEYVVGPNHLYLANNVHFT